MESQQKDSAAVADLQRSWLKISKPKMTKFVGYGRQLYYLKYKDFVSILEDESYFTLTSSEINRYDNFYSSNAELTPNEAKFKRQIWGQLLAYAIVPPTWGLTPTNNTIWDRN